MVSAWLAKVKNLINALRSSRRAQLSLLTLALLALSGILLHSSWRKGGLWDESRFNDFRAYHTASRLVLRQELHSAYEETQRPYQYPPTLAALLAPLGLLPERAALVLWSLGCLAALLWTFRVLDELLGPPVTGLDKFLGLVLVFRLVESDFANSNANTLVLGLVAGGFLLERRQRPAWSGFAIALAACVKVFPALIFPWMLYRGRWRMALGFLGGLLLWGVVVPGTIIGPSDFAASFRAWHRHMLAPLSPDAPSAQASAPDYVPGQSLRSLLHHLLRRTDSTAHDEEAVAVNLVDWPRPAVEWIYRALGAGLLGGALLLFRSLSSCRRMSGPEISAAGALAVLISPLSRKAHFVLLLPAAAMGFALARTSWREGRRWPAALWGAAFLLIVLSSNLLGDRLSALAMAFCPLSLAALLLLALQVEAERRLTSGSA
ncbi:MAG: DUF2029 domain-containing protein [Planctomycetes bacterium]|nr:DUF2029 domain-containing protein [Planctomycetota bacterium]